MKTNLNRFKHYTVASFVAEKSRREKGRKELWASATVILVVFALGGSAIVVTNKIAAEHMPKPEVIIDGVRSTIDQDDRGNSTRWALWVGAARTADSKWEVVLPNVPTLRFKLIANAEACGPEAIACADVTRNIIYVAKDGADVDRTTIMMHEIAHLRGVPHIEGDPLMDRSYQGALSIPSNKAIAIARLSNAGIFPDIHWTTTEGGKP